MEPPKKRRKSVSGLSNGRDCESSSSMIQLKKIFELPTTTTNVCNYCARIVNKEYFNPGDRSVTPRIPTHCKHHPSVASLLKSAALCPLCEFFASLFDRDDLNSALERDHESVATACRVVWHGFWEDIKASELEQELSNINTLLRHQYIISIGGKQWESVTYDFFIHRGPQVEDSSHPSFRPIWASSSPITLNVRTSLFRQWLNDCDDHHDACQAQRASAGRFEAPKWLLFVGDETQMELRLVDGRVVLDNVSCPKRYACLSHCWGGKHLTHPTVRANVAYQMRSIDMDTLPKTFRDAITIARVLQINYLWIDGLCITQDDELEWQREVAKMASLFEHAYVTLAAGAASDCESGCFIEPMAHATHCQIGAYSICARAPVLDDDRGGPMDSRRWIFQEMLLSNRVLRFQKDQAWWQCSSILDLESGKEYRGLPDRHLYRFSEQLRSNLDDEGQADEMWWYWVQEYTERSLSYHMDVLPALAGATRKYMRLYPNDVPVVGLWKNSLVFHLAWTTRYGQPGSLDRIPTLPSWSWVSIFGPPYHGTQYAGINHIRHQDFYEDDPPEPPSCVLWKCDIPDTDIRWSGEELTSRLDRVALKIRSCVRPAMVDPDNPGPFDHVYPDIAPPYEEDPRFDYTVMPLYITQRPSRSSPTPPESDKNVKIISEIEEVGLVIEADSNHAGSYRRTGLFRRWWQCKDEEARKMVFEDRNRTITLL